MQQNSSTPSASAPAPNNKRPIAGLEHLAHLGKENYAAEVQLVSTPSATDCRFWVSVYQRGETSPSEISKESSPTEIFKKASDKGIDSCEAIMLSDCESGQTTFTLLVPENNQDLHAWTDSLLFAIESAKPKVIGIHISKKVMDSQTLADALTSLFERSLTGSQQLFSKIYLIADGYSYNKALNLIFDLKKDLHKNQNVELKLLH